MIFQDLDDIHTDASSAINYSEFYHGREEIAFQHDSSAKIFFQKARNIADLGCGTGASSLHIHKICPQAEITTVDNMSKPFDEIIKLMDGKHKQHINLSIQDFLEQEKGLFDIFYVVKSSHGIRKGDPEKLAAHLVDNGYLFQIEGDVGLPEEMKDFFEPIFIDIDRRKDGTIALVNGLWKKKTIFFT